MSGLSATDRALLDVARRQYRSPNAHADAVRDELGLSLTEYFHRVNQLVDDPEALAYSPIVINRLRRSRRA
ncbi:DUF3263 domain-containing protein [Gordonia zhaorongruii]|uniref:DUF3263 domain-containing protein n=1 Tax=Gordonia zhaorongruii TaxID=2597659 RepID=UPI00140510C6|nr:DUF3263 domain-containing protein [Gordonia zhaorongruii]